MAEILPMGFHYMLGIIYSISILVLIVSSALGYEKGTMVWKNFAKGLLTFQFVEIALVIVNATVNQYAAMHAADFLSSIGQNPATITSIPYYIHYVATMTGVAGILGVSAIFLIPGMVFSGEVGMAVGALSGLANKYKGNDIQTATSESAQQKAQNAAWESDLRDRAKLEHMGLAVPPGMGATQFYAEYQKDIQAANAGFGAATMGMSVMNEAGHAVKGQTMQSITAGATLNAGATMDDFVAAGAGQGMMSVKQVGSMKAYGSNSSLPQSMKAGEFEGTLNAAKDTWIADNGTMGDAKTLGSDSSMQQLGKAKGLQKAGVFNEDGSINTTMKDAVLGISEFNLYKQGLENQSRISANKTMGAGRLGELDNAQMTNVQRVAEAGVIGEIAKGQTLKDKYGANLEGGSAGVSYSNVAHKTSSLQEDKAIGTAKGYDKLNPKTIQDNAEYELESSTKSTKAAIDKKGGKGHDRISKAADVDAVDAGLRAASQKSILDSNLKEGGAKNGLDSSADKIAAAIEKLANTAGTKAGAQTRADMASIATAGNGEKFKELQANNARLKTDSLIGTTQGDLNKMNNDNFFQKLVNKHREGLTPGSAKYNKATKELENLKILDSNGNLNKNRDERFQGLMQATKGNMAGMHGVTIGSSSYNISGGVGSSNDSSRISKDTSTTDKSGDEKQVLYTKKDVLNAIEASKTSGVPVEKILQQEEQNEADRDLPGKGKAKLAAAQVKRREEKKKEKEKGNPPTDKSLIEEIKDYALDHSEAILIGGELGAGVVTAGVGLNKLSKIAAPDNIPKTLEDMPGAIKQSDGSYLAKDGKTVFTVDDRGRVVQNNKVVMKPNPKAKSGVFKRRWDKIWNRGDSDFGSKSSSDTMNSTANVSDDTPDNINSSSPDETLNQEKPHNDSFNKDIPNDTTTEKKVNSKPEKIKGDLYKKTDSGLFVPENTSLRKEVTDVEKHIPKEGTWGKILDEVSHIPKVGKTLAAAGAIFTGTELLGAKNQTDVDTALDPFFSSSMGDGEHLPPITKSVSLKEINQAALKQGIKTFNDAQNDSGMPTAIDTFNTQQNVHAIQNTQPGRVLSMQTRGGEMKFIGNSKTGNMDVHVPDAPFATHTNIPVTQFQSIFNDPTQQQQFAQMVAQSNYNEKAGKKFDAGVEGNIQKNIKGAEAAERARYAMNPEKWVEGIAAKGHDAGVQALQKLGFDKKEAEDMYSEIAAPTAGVAGSIAIAEITSRIRGNGSYVGRVWGALPNPFDKAGKNPESPTSNSNNPQPDSEVNNKGQHNDSLNKDLPNDTTTEKKSIEILSPNNSITFHTLLNS